MSGALDAGNGGRAAAFHGSIVGPDDAVLVTGATGFIGTRVVATLLDYGFRRVRCFARPSSDVAGIEAIGRAAPAARIEVVRGNLLSPADCVEATRDVAVIYHLAAGTGEKSFPEAFRHSVVTTRNLLDAALRHGGLRRFVSAELFRGLHQPGQAPAAAVRRVVRGRRDARASAARRTATRRSSRTSWSPSTGRSTASPTSSSGPGSCTGPARRRSAGASAPGPSGSSSTSARRTRSPSPTSTTARRRSCSPGCGPASTARC